MDTFSVFIAGTMQGSRKGSDQIVQDYRSEIERLVKETYSQAVINCPLKIMAAKLWADEAGIRASHQALGKVACIETESFDQHLKKLTGTFHELVDISASSDICIAFLPNHEASMGTAAEMFAAYRAGKIVITITEMTQNLAVMSCSSFIIPTLSHLSGALEMALQSKQ